MSDATQSKSNGMATASLILGILSIVLGFFGWLGIICGVLAIIFAVVAKNKIKEDPALSGTSGQAKGGLITGIIGCVIGVIVMILILWVFSTVADAALDTENWKELENLNNN